MVIKREMRLNVYERDNNRCVKCGSSEKLTVDHIVPLIAGGSNLFKNLQTLCFNCNQEKGSKQKISFLERLKSIWNIHNILNEYKSSVNGLVMYENERNKKLIEVMCSNKVASLQANLVKNIQSEIQSKSDKQINFLSIAYETKHKEFELIVNGLNNTINLKDKRIKDLEDALFLLTDYLGIECVPSKTKPYFRKTND